MRGIAEKPTRLCGVVPMSRAAWSGIVVSMEELITPAPLFTPVLTVPALARDFHRSSPVARSTALVAA